MSNFLKRLIHKWLFSYVYEIKISDGGQFPKRSYKNDAGFDIYISRSTMIEPGQSINVPTGIYCRSKHVPAWILMTSRSSTLIKHGIVVDDGVIDGDYTGEMFVKVYNISNEVKYLNPGMRIAQIIVLPHTNVKFVPVQEMKQTRRGQKGFGSTGN